MPEEDAFVAEAMKIAKEILSPPLVIRRKASLYYQLMVDNRLKIPLDPRKPKRGQSAFQTDLCIFEELDTNLEIPRVVMEFKSRLSTHDILTYNAKARKHKQIYPYLRYGIIISKTSSIPGRFFTHNESLDFCVAVASFRKNRTNELFSSLFREEVAMSRLLEQIAYEKISSYVFRNNIAIETGTGKTL